MTVFRLRQALQFAMLALSLVLFFGVDAARAQTLTSPFGTQNIFNTPNYDSNNPNRSGSSDTGQDNYSNGTSIRNNTNGQTGNTGTDATQNGNRSNVNQSTTRPDNTLRDNIPRRAPNPPSEFQKFVQGATGRLLPMFGARFFEDAENGASPLDNVPVSADYIVGPGDELMIRAWGSIDVDYRARVDRNGQINLPRIGSFTVAGVRASQLEEHLRAQISKLFTNFNLNVTLGQLRGVKVFVVGPAVRPGVYTLPSQSTLLSAVVAAGGPLSSGSMRKIGLRRDGRIVSELDVYEFLVQGDKSKDVQLMPGDVVVFNAAGPRIALTGAVDTPAIYELRSPQEPLREVLRYAGGAPLLANPNMVQIERVDNTQSASRFVEQFKLDGNGLQKPLRDGDVVTMLAISPQFANAVTLRGHVAQPLRYPYTPGMRIRDLIPDRDALISRDFYRRKNLLVQMLPEERGRDTYPYSSGDRQYMRNGADRSSANGSRYRNETGGSYSSNRDGTARGDREDAFESGDMLTGGNVRGSGADNAAGYGDGVGRSSGGQARGDGRYQEGGRDMYDNRSSGMDRSGTQRLASTSTLFDELNWDYAVIERLDRNNLKTQLIPFNLGKAILQNDPTQNLELQPGDVVTIYSQRDMKVPVARQTRLVTLEGEIGSPGVYQLQAGETLKHLVSRAGGFTPQAYVYGLEFSREDTRQKQRENLQQAIARLESLAATQAAREAANRREDQASSSVSNAATQAQLARLRRLQPNGRIALELQPDAGSIDALPDVPLEGGDRIIVPARPGFVTVAGAVVNSNAFLWKSGRNAGDYMKLAGLDEAADPSNMFILRADGTVSHAGDRRGFFGIGGGLQGQPMYPGDALIVPNQLDYETWGRAFIRNLKDFSQIFSQFGLGAAAIVTLRNSN